MWHSPAGLTKRIGTSSKAENGKTTRKDVKGFGKERRGRIRERRGKGGRNGNNMERGGPSEILEHGYADVRYLHHCGDLNAVRVGTATTTDEAIRCGMDAPLPNGSQFPNLRIMQMPTST